MGNVRGQRRTYPTASQPTPIATGEGKRSAAVHEDVFSNYLYEHLTVPHLSLPSEKRRSRPTSTPPPDNVVIASVDLSSLISWSSSHRLIEDDDAVVLPVISAAIADVGVFQIVNHGLSPDLIGPLADLDNSCWQITGHILPERQYRYKLLPKRQISTAGATENERVQSSAQVEYLYLELEKIAQALCLVFEKMSTGRRPENRTAKSTTEAVLRVRIYQKHSYYKDDLEEDKERTDEEQDRNIIHAFTLHLILGDWELQFRRHNSVVASFSTKPGSVLVTSGKQLRVRTYFT